MDSIKRQFSGADSLRLCGDSMWARGDSINYRILCVDFMSVAGDLCVDSAGSKDLRWISRGFYRADSIVSRVIRF